MVPTPRLSAIVALVGVSRLTLNVSPEVPSNTVSLVILMVTVCVVVPGAKVNVPLAAL